jgi:DNA helicase II / ATP-dependent DNA helicase PcrA
MKTDLFDEKYKSLNTKQREAVDAIEGPVMVVAGPGTGKTTILTLRIANILRQTDTTPENILALSFTNSGVSAIRNKLLEYIGDSAYRVNIFTFHAFAENIIKEFGFYFKDLEFSKVISDLEKVEIIEEIIKNGKFIEIVSKNDLFSSLSQIKNAIDDIKQEGLSPEEFKSRIPQWEKQLSSDENLFYKKKFGKYNAGDVKPAEKEKLDKKIAKAIEIAQVFEKYQKEIKAKGRYDFSDMILNVLKELEKNKNLKLDLQEQYQYLLIDEHQDTNDGQNRLIELLTDAEHLGGKPNLFTVGDEKQSIYRFQGASEKSFRHFNEIYKDVDIINLENNYRSTQNILDSSHSLISYTVKELVKLKSYNKNNTEKIKFLEFSNYKFELLHLAQDIKNKMEKEKTDPQEIAVIYRSNKHVEELKEVFNQKNIPFTIISNEYLLENANINNLISILKVINNPKDNHNLAKSLLVDFLNIDSYKVADILEKFNRENRKGDRALFDFIAEDKEFKEFVSKIKTLKTKAANTNFDMFFKEFLNEIGYIKHMLKSPDNRQELIKIDKLFDEIKRQMQNKKGYALSDFVKFIDACKKYNLDIGTNDPEIIEGVQLMTAHKSKGLEFEYVYIVGATRKNWEKSRSFGSIALPIDDYKGDTDDERRLFYVSMTRAKTGLCISSSLTDWEGKPLDKSQFITEIDQNLIENIDTNKFEKENIHNFALFVAKSNSKKSLFDKEYLKKLFLTKNINVTALNNYCNCPIKYLFRNLIQLPSEYSASLLYGDLVHDSLEKFFEESKNDKKIASKNDLIKIFRKFIEKSSFYGGEYERYLQRGEGALEEYYDHYHKNWTLEIENEKYITKKFELDSGEIVNLSGRLDKVEFLDSVIEGKINIIDYKTGRPFSEKTKKSEKDDLKRQLVFYHILYEDYMENKFTINKAILDFVEKNKRGEFEQYTLEISKDEINEVKQEINKMVSEVLSGEFLSLGCARKDCEYCSYRKLL